MASVHSKTFPTWRISSEAPPRAAHPRREVVTPRGDPDPSDDRNYFLFGIIYAHPATTKPDYRPQLGRANNRQRNSLKLL